MDRSCARMYILYSAIRVFHMFGMLQIMKGTYCHEINQRGRHFVIVFPGSGTDDNINIIVLTSENDVTVYLMVPGQNDTKYSIPSGQSERIYLGHETTVTSNMVVEKKAIQIVASDVISVYGYISQYDSMGGFLVLPVESLSREYIAVSYLPYKGKGGHVLVGAVEDDTIVNVTMKVSAGGMCNDHWTTVGDVFTFTLDHLQVVRIFCDSDITGTYVTSSKPVCVLSGNPLTQVPHDVPFDDNIVEMMIPTYAFGKQYVMGPIAGRNSGALFRVIAQEDNTRVSGFDGNVIYMSKLDYVDLDLPPNTHRCLKSTKPVLLVQFGKGQSFDGPEYEGDPFMTIVPPIERYTSKYLLDLYTSASTPTHVILPYLSLAARLGSLAGVKHVVPTTIVKMPVCNMVVVAENVSGGILEISAPGRGGIGITVHGLVSWKAYGYMAGIRLDDFSGETECASTPCLNDGLCYEVGLMYKCYCVDNFFGEHCEYDIVNQCMSSPCGNNGDCVDLVNDYMCVCKPSYTGKQCQEVVTTTALPLSSEGASTTSPQEVTTDWRVTTQSTDNLKVVTDTTTETVDTTSENPNTPACQCTCKNITYKEAEEKVKVIKEELKINPIILSKSKRKFQSMQDTRTSAASIGYIGGVFLTLVFGSIFLIDVSTFVSRHVFSPRSSVV